MSQFGSVRSSQSLSPVWLLATPWTATCQALILAPGVLFQILKSLHPWALLHNAHSSDQFSCSVLSNSLWPYELQYAKPSPLSPTLGAYSNSCPLSQWHDPTISSSVILFFFVILFSFCLKSFPASESFRWVSSLHQVAKVLEFQLQHHSFQWIFRTDFL